MEQVARTGQSTVDPNPFRISYAITLHADTVPPGYVVKCWMPFPRIHMEIQPEIYLLAVYDDDYIIAPPEHLQRTLYLEKTAAANQPTVFETEFEMATVARWFDIDPESVGSW